MDLSAFTRMVEGTLVLRPGYGSRITLWILAAFGLVFGLSALAATDPVQQTLMALFGLLCVVIGANGGIARVTCDERGLYCRRLVPVRVPSSEVVSVTVRSVAGYGYRRIRIDIDRRFGAPLRLTSLQRADTPRNLVKSEADADAIRRTLAIPHPAAVKTSRTTT